MARILAVSGSPSSASRTAALLALAARALADAGHRVDVLHLRDLPPAALLAADADEPELARARRLLDDADGVVVGSPVYKAAYTGLLKAWLDSLPQAALAGKAVLPLVTGGSLAHALTLEYALHPVLSSLAAGRVARGAFILDRDITRSGEPQGPALAPDTRPRLTRAVTGFLDVLPVPAQARSAA